MTGALRIASSRSWFEGTGQRHLPIGMGQFSLVQLAVVAIILGMLCGMVVASLKTPIAQARESALAATLQNLRTQITTYRLQHSDNLPAATLLPQLLTSRSDAAGNIGQGPQYSAGPYYTSLPANPYNSRSDIKVVQEGLPLIPDGTTGWLYQAQDGDFKIIANSPERDTAGRPLANY